MVMGALDEKTRAGLAGDETLNMVFTGVHLLLSCALRLRVDPKSFVGALVDIGVPHDYAQDMARAYGSGWEQLTEAAHGDRVDLATIENVDWRVDVTISTTSLSRVFKPSITMRLTLSDGRIVTFETSAEKFHDLRYNVAKTLNAIQNHASHHNRRSFRCGRRGQRKSALAREMGAVR